MDTAITIIVGTLLASFILFTISLRLKKFAKTGVCSCAKGTSCGGDCKACFVCRRGMGN